MEEKQQIVDRLKAGRLWGVVDKSAKVWKDAFALYNRETGERLDMGCNKCFAKVMVWLEKP